MTARDTTLHSVPDALMSNVGETEFREHDIYALGDGGSRQAKETAMVHMSACMRCVCCLFNIPEARSILKRFAYGKNTKEGVVLLYVRRECGHVSPRVAVDTDLVREFSI